MIRRILMAAVLAAVALDAFAARGTLIVLPLSNISGADEAPAAVRDMFAARFAKRGWDVVPLEKIEPALEEERVRYLDSLPAESRAALLEKFGASAVVTGTVLAWRDGTNPSVAISARMANEEGRVVWGNAASMSASEIEGALGMGRPKNAADLARTVVSSVLEGFPKPGRRSRVARGPQGIERPITYRSKRHPRGEIRRVAILPFTTPNADGARVVMELLTVRLEASGEFEVIEPAEFRAAMRAQKLNSIATMTSAELAKLGEALGTSIFLRGNVYAFRDAGPRSEVHLDMNLADVRSGAVLWAVTHQRFGTDYSGLLQRGTVENVVALADRVVCEAIAAQARAKTRDFIRKAGP